MAGGTTGADSRGVARDLLERFCFPNGGSVGVVYNVSAYEPPPAKQGNARFVEGGRDLLASAPGLRAITLGVHEQTRLRVFTDTPAQRQA